MFNHVFNKFNIEDSVIFELILIFAMFYMLSSIN